MRLFRSTGTLIISACILSACAVGGQSVRAPEEEMVPTLRLGPYKGPKKTIAVLGFRNKADSEDPAFNEFRVGRGITEMLKTALVKSGRFRVVERSKQITKKILEEQWLGLRDEFDQTTAARTGRMLGAKAVIYGNVSEFGVKKTGVYVGLGGVRTVITRIVVDVFMVDTETGEILEAATGAGAEATQSSGIIMVWEEGVESFDETTVGKATRKACYRVVERLARSVSGEEEEDYEEE